MPFPCTTSTLLALGIFTFGGSCAFPPLTTALANGWSLKSSTAMAVFSKSSFLISPKLMVSVNFGLPSVRVPVLSNAKAVKEPKSSNGRPPFIKTPPRAALATPLSTADGVEMANAQGLAATKTA